MLRIIAGKYRGHHIKSPPSSKVRPTSDRLRETLFNVLAPRIENARFLDLCAGSGAVGIEALSRGAIHATFVDRSRKMCALIEANLDLLRVPEVETEVIHSEAAAFLRQFKPGNRRKTESWNLIYFDPPYATDYETALRLIGKDGHDVLADDGLLVVEHNHKKHLDEQMETLVRIRVLKQGDAALSFYEPQKS
jgi:16S rRNA (guanine(966)-N(2))-methyltransferase RsmD